MAVQVPEQTLKQVSVTTTLEDGETLFIDPRLQIEAETVEAPKLPFQKPKTIKTNKQVYFLVTSQIVQTPKQTFTSQNRSQGI